MIKFFRHIRRNLLNKNKVGKYLLYAFGEIILVIIGILIALSLNKQSEQKQAEAKIDAILVEVLNELGSNINNTNELMQFYKTKDTLFYLVLNDKLTYEDYENPKIPGLFNLITNYRTVTLNRFAFDNLLQNMNAIPEKYNEVVKELTFLHSTIKNIVDNNNEIMRSMMLNNFSERSAKFDWHSKLGNARENKARIDYILNNYLYKNKVYDYRVWGKQNHLQSILNYRINAVDLYQKLAVLLDKPETHESFKINEETAKLFICAWKNIESDRRMKITFENSKLSNKYLDSSSTIFNMLILSSKNLTSKKIVSTLDNSTYLNYIFKKDTLVRKANASSSKWIRH